MTEHTYLGSNINLVKAHNLQAVLLTLLAASGHRPEDTGQENLLSRVQLARKTNLSNTTITNLVCELLEQGVLVEEGAQSQEEPRPVGRPRTGLRLVPDARYALGVHIGVGMFRVAIVNLYAEMLDSKIEEFSLETSAEEVMQRIAASVNGMIVASGIDRERILGVGIGASGLVNYPSGVNVLAPNLGWHNVPIRSCMEEALRLPVTVDNNVRAMALGEAYFGLGRGVDTLAFVYGRIGVGAGFVVEGQVFRGSGTGAGEIGHVIMIPEGGDLCRCGQRGCLETLVSEPVILRQAKEIALHNPNSLLANKLRQESDTRSIERVFDAARQGDGETQALIEKRAYYLGVTLANLVNTLNPELILLGGMFAQGEDLFLPIAEQTMRQLAFAGMGEKVRLQTTSFGWRAGVIGAAVMALMSFFYRGN
jgi:glucokinase-like ROK family protein